MVSAGKGVGAVHGDIARVLYSPECISRTVDRLGR